MMGVVAGTSASIYSVPHYFTMGTRPSGVMSTTAWRPGELRSRRGGARGVPYPTGASPAIEDQLPVVMPVRDLWSGGGELSRDPSERSTSSGEGIDDVDA